MRSSHQTIPPAGPARELLREKGQYWTPEWVARAMAAYALGAGADHLFDPAVGAGAILRAAKAVAAELLGRSVTLLGTEIDAGVLSEALASGLSRGDIERVEIADFVLAPPQRRYSAIAANPPYIRHHRIPPDVKAALRRLSQRVLGTPLDGRAGYHVYFLIQALQLLEPGGRLAFLVPADTCEGIFAPVLWNWIVRNYRLEAVVTFTPDAAPFPQVDTNALLLLISRDAPCDFFWWARCAVPDSPHLEEWCASGFAPPRAPGLRVWRRRVDEGLRTGLSRPPMDAPSTGPVLGDFARVMRGIATGANDFFFLTARRAAEWGLPREFLRPAVGRTRDVSGIDEISTEHLHALEAAGRPTLLLTLDGRPRESFPASVQEYLRYGEQLGIHQRPLTRARRCWYRVERRDVPPILFAYLGRRSARFLLNRAGVIPLTGFLCVYPRHQHAASLERLWLVLRHPQTRQNFALVGKSYGNGAVKVEPRALERLPLPEHLLQEAGLDAASSAHGP
jgi:adenine-specific DNA-methyltransferase